jgi:hypothetical protein
MDCFHSVSDAHQNKTMERQINTHMHSRTRARTCILEYAPQHPWRVHAAPTTSARTAPTTSARTAPRPRRVHVSRPRRMHAPRPRLVNASRPRWVHAPRPRRVHAPHPHPGKRRRVCGKCTSQHNPRPEYNNNTGRVVLPSSATRSLLV